MTIRLLAPRNDGGATSPALDEIWKPYRQRKGTRDEAIAALVARVGQ